MTAPQHTAKPKADQPRADKPRADQSDSSCPPRYRLQRCWFVTLGLLGSFSFIASQVSLARAESSDYSVNDFSVSESVSEYEAANSAASSAAAAAAAVPLTMPGAESFSNPLATALPAASLDSAAAIAPQVTPIAPPSFTAAKKPVAAKPAQRRNPFAGLIEASAMAATMATNDTATEAAPQTTPTAPPAGVPDIAPAPAPAAPPTAAPVQPTDLVPTNLPGGNLPEEYNSVFVDPTDYSVGATEAPNVVISEQSTGCEFTVGQGQAVPNGVCASQAGAPAASGRAAAAPSAAPAASAARSTATASGSAVNVGPVSFSASGIRFSGSTTAAGRDFVNRSVRPLVNLQAARQFIFPLSIPAPITSLFGFRIHPISGDQRFHAGTDIGAPQGTPVLAAQDGVVTSADYAGGYGLMVVLRHQTDGTQLETRYAHLSEIFVESGKSVKKGDVVGLVGSTGNSTGPHLHFEMHQLTADGWVVVNPDGLIQQSLASLVRVLNDPTQALSFSLADFNLGNARASGVATQTNPGNILPSLLPGQNGISFRPAQPNAS
ncbi:MAG: M23 family metallopeptidase [Phormidesmis sp.]